LAGNTTHCIRANTPNKNWLESNGINVARLVCDGSGPGKVWFLDSDDVARLTAQHEIAEEACGYDGINLITGFTVINRAQAAAPAAPAATQPPTEGTVAPTLGAPTPEQARQAQEQPTATPPASAVPAGQFTVTIGENRGAVDDRFPDIKALIERMFAPVIQKNVVFTVPHENVSQPHGGPEFYIHMFSSPMSNNGRMPVPEKMWGIKVDCRDAGNFSPWPEGQPIVTAEGHEVAGFDDNNLYVYWDAIEMGTDNELKLFEKLLSVAAESLKNPNGGFDVEAQKQLYIGLCLKRVESDIASYERNIAKYDSDIKQATERFHQLHLDRQMAMRSYAAAKNFRDEDKTKFLAEFDALCRSPHVQKVAIRNNIISVYTDTLYCVDPRSNKEHELGKFRINVNLNTGELTMFNTTRLVHGMEQKMHAPHVFPSGKPCLGEHATNLHQLLAAFEVNLLVQTSVIFLTSVNVDDPAGRHIDKWPLSTRSAEEQAKEKPLVLEGGKTSSKKKK